MHAKHSEISVGLFMILGMACLVYLSVNLGAVTIWGSGHYTLSGVFGSIEGLEPGASVEIAGVPVGKVADVVLDNDNARVFMNINKGVKVSEDTIASIRTKGVIGDKFVRLSPGGSDEILKDGDVLTDTESAVSLEELISKYIFEK